mgnify:CR=1 FL=1
MSKLEKIAIQVVEESSGSNKKKQKEYIPKALREQVWMKRMGKTFCGKCTVSWCEN